MELAIPAPSRLHRETSNPTEKAGCIGPPPRQNLLVEVPVSTTQHMPARQTSLSAAITTDPRYGKTISPGLLPQAAFRVTHTHCCAFLLLALASLMVRYPSLSLGPLRLFFLCFFLVQWSYQLLHLTALAPDFCLSPSFTPHPDPRHQVFWDTSTKFPPTRGRSIDDGCGGIVHCCRVTFSPRHSADQLECRLLRGISNLNKET